MTHFAALATSFIGRSCAVVVAAIWLSYFGSQLLSPVFTFLPQEYEFQAYAFLVVAALVLSGLLIWPRLAYLKNTASMANVRCRIGVALLAASLVGFPGTVVFPLVAAELSGRAEYEHLSLYSVYGIPAFVFLSLAGLFLIRPPKALR